MPRQILIYLSMFAGIVNLYLLYLVFLGERFDKDESIIYAFIIAVISVLGSLYFSDILGMEPWKLCWFQRIFMYPLVLIFYIAYKNKYAKIFRYTLPMTIFGGLISLYHYLMQMIPSIFSPDKECQGVSCTIYYLHEFGFVTIPYMALMAFVAITLIAILGLRKNNK